MPAVSCMRNDLFEFSNSRGGGGAGEGTAVSVEFFSVKHTL